MAVVRTAFVPFPCPIRGVFADARAVSPITVDEYVATYLSRRPRLSPKTLESYGRGQALYISPTLGSQVLATVTPGVADDADGADPRVELGGLGRCRCPLLAGWGCRFSGPNSSMHKTTVGPPGAAAFLPSAMSFDSEAKVGQPRH